MAEIEISILARGALSRPRPRLETLRQRVAAQAAECNARRCPIRWQFTTVDAHTTRHDLRSARNTQLD